MIRIALWYSRCLIARDFLVQISMEFAAESIQFKPFEEAELIPKLPIDPGSLWGSWQGTQPTWTTVPKLDMARRWAIQGSLLLTSKPQGPESFPGWNSGPQWDTPSHSFLYSTSATFPSCQISKLRFCVGLYFPVQVCCSAWKLSPLAMPWFIPKPRTLTLIFSGLWMQNCYPGDEVRWRWGGVKPGSDCKCAFRYYLSSECDPVESVSIICYKGAYDSHVCPVRIKMYPLGWANVFIYKCNFFHFYEIMWNRIYHNYCITGP